MDLLHHHRSSSDQERLKGRLKIIAVSVLGIVVVPLAYRKLIMATTDLGKLFGWIIGASKSPISSAVAPLVFGLLGAVILASVSKVMLSAVECNARKFFGALATAWLAAHLTTCFVFNCWEGISAGEKVRARDQASLAIGGVEGVAFDVHRQFDQLGPGEHR